MRVIHLKEFIKTGFFGSITIGSTKEEVIEILGNKYDFGDFGESQIIKYTWYEFFYWTVSGKVFGIQNDHLQADCGNHDKMIHYKSRKWKLDTWFLQTGKNITFKEVKNYLIQESIDYKIEPSSPFNNDNIIRCMNSNVTFDFCSDYHLFERDKTGKLNEWKEVKIENEDDFVLNGIRLFES
jgi:hypothetical protein